VAEAGQEAEDGSVSLEADTLRYSVGGALVWELPIESVRVIGELTTDGGPWSDDHFLVFVVAGHPPLFHEVPVEGAPSTTLLNALSYRLGAPLVLGLVNRTDFASRVMWPPQLTDHDLFRFHPEPRSGGLWSRAMDALVPMLSHALTEEVVHYAEQADSSI